MNLARQQDTDGDDIVLDGRLVCIVDDDELFRLHLAALLGQERLRSVQASDSAGLVEILQKEMPDCILLDYNLDAENGLRLHEQLKLRFPRLAPVIMLSADESQRTAIKAFRMGIFDFVQKRNLRIDEVAAAIRNSIARHERESTREDEVSVLRKRAMFDGLTGMFTREELDRKLALVADTAGRTGSEYAVLAIRFAEYRRICTSLGVASAEEALRAFAGRIRANIREDDFCGRFDEDTFFYVMDRRVTEDSVRERRERFSAQLAFSQFIKSLEVRVTPHISVALAGAEDDDEQMIERLCRELDNRQTAQRSVEGSESWGSLPAGSPGSGMSGEPEERRASQRTRTLKPAFIALEEWSSKISCTARNISDGGARIRLERPLALPDYFLVQITASGPLRRVRKCWHMNNEIGIEFCD